jgi:hypothetical protein
MLIFLLLPILEDATACEMPVAGKPVAIANQAAAVAAAKAAWQSVYSKARWHSEFSPEHVAEDEPYVAVLKNGVWHVYGTLPHDAIGGTPEARICQSDGMVLVTTHGQ